MFIFEYTWPDSIEDWICFVAIALRQITRIFSLTLKFGLGQRQGAFLSVVRGMGARGGGGWGKQERGGLSSRSEWF